MPKIQNRAAKTKRDVIVRWRCDEWVINKICVIKLWQYLSNHRPTCGNLWISQNSKSEANSVCSLSFFKSQGLLYGLTRSWVDACTCVLISDVSFTSLQENVLLCPCAHTFWLKKRNHRRQKSKVLHEIAFNCIASSLCKPTLWDGYSPVYLMPNTQPLPGFFTLSSIFNSCVPELLIEVSPYLRQVRTKLL